MNQRTIWLVLCVAALAAAPAVADVGNLSLSVTPVNTPGSLQVDLDLDATTTGASTPAATDSVFMLASMYYPTPYSAATTYGYDYGYVTRTGTTNHFQQTVSFTVPHPGHYGYFGVVEYTERNTDYQYGTLDVTESSPIPAVGLPGLLILGVILAGTGAFILRRA